MRFNPESSACPTDTERAWGAEPTTEQLAEIDLEKNETASEASALESVRRRRNENLPEDPFGEDDEDEVVLPEEEFMAHLALHQRLSGEGEDVA